MLFRPRPKLFMPILIIVLTFLTFSVALHAGACYMRLEQSEHTDGSMASPCDTPPSNCIFTLVESIPENLTYPAGSPQHVSTFAGIQGLLKQAKETIEIASYYWTMLPEDLPVQDPSNWQGSQLFSDLVEAATERGVKIKIVQSASKKPVHDTELLAQKAGAEIRSLDLDRLIGSGILHTKLWLIDRKHYYVGSANLDWRSFTQVKEMGTVVQQCDCLAQDMGKIFDVYWILAQPSSQIPPFWPESFNTLYNASNPMPVTFNGTQYSTYLSSSPPPLCPRWRANDGKTIVDIIDDADKFVYIAVMDYFPTTQFTHPRSYWPVIDDALRRAAFNRRVHVRLLASRWDNTWLEMYRYLTSLQELNISSKFMKMSIEVKLFVVPAYTEAQKKIPYSRVNHNKYMVTDKVAYIGTSNWAGDYFLKTGGIGIVVKPESGQSSPSDIRQQLQDVFERDWNSEYTFSLSHFNITSTTVES